MFVFRDLSLQYLQPVLYFLLAVFDVVIFFIGLRVELTEFLQLLFQLLDFVDYRMHGIAGFVEVTGNCGKSIVGGGKDVCQRKTCGLYFFSKPLQRLSGSCNRGICGGCFLG